MVFRPPPPTQLLDIELIDWYDTSPKCQFSLGVSLIYVYAFGNRGFTEGRPDLDKTELSCDGCAEIWMDDIYGLIRPDSVSLILVWSAFCNMQCDRIKIRVWAELLKWISFHYNIIWSCLCILMEIVKKGLLCILLVFFIYWISKCTV